MHVVEHPAEHRVDDLMAQQIYRLHQRHSGLQQRGEFLVKDEKFVPGDFPALQKDAAAAQDVALAQRQDVQALVLEIMAKARFAFRRVGAFDDLASRRDQPAAKFHAKWLKL